MSIDNCFLIINLVSYRYEVKTMTNDTLFEHFVSFIASVHRVQHDLTKDAMPEGLTALQYSILEHIAVSRQPLTPSDISSCFHISMPNTSRELKKLTEQGLVERKESEEDRRKQFIHLSADGRAMMDEVFKQIHARFLERIGDTTNEKMDTIAHALDVLQKHVFYE